MKLLEQHLAARGIPLEAMINFKPGMLSTMLTVIELQKLGLLGTGVDEFYTQKASSDEKQIEELETLDEQIQFVADMGKGEEDQFIAYTIRDIGQLESMFDELKTAWREGDMEKMAAIGIEPMKTEFPALFKLILTCLL